MSIKIEKSMKADELYGFPCSNSRPTSTDVIIIFFYTENLEPEKNLNGHHEEQALIANIYQKTYQCI